MQENEYQQAAGDSPTTHGTNLGYLWGRFVGNVVGFCALLCVLFIGLGCVALAFKFLWRSVWE